MGAVYFIPFPVYNINNIKKLSFIGYIHIFHSGGVRPVFAVATQTV